MAGIVYTYNRGNLTFGGQTHDINQSWVNNSPTRVVQIGDKPIWPSFTVGCVDGTLNFTAGKGGGMQGDFTITNSEYLQGTAGKIFPGDIYQIDPAGGNGTVNIKTSESSYWHQLSLKVHFEQSNFQYQQKEDAKVKIVNTDITAKSKNRSEATELNVISDNTYTFIPYNVLLNSNINSDGKILTSLSNEEEHNQDYMPISVKDYAKNGDAKISWSIGPNNNIQSSYTKLVVDGFYDLLGNYYPITKTENKPVLFKVFQNPNILYYVHLAFCQSVPSDYGAPTTVDSIETDYNATNTKFYVFIELGKSPDGGNNIYWNDPNNDSDIDNQIHDITKELTLSVKDDSSLNYTVSVNGFVMNGNKRTNYVECTLTNNANDELNNKSGMTQQYLIKNKKFINYKYINGNFYKDPLYGALLEASEVKDSTIEEKFQIYRTTATQSVSVTIEAELHSGNYNL